MTTSRQSSNVWKTMPANKAWWLVPVLLLCGPCASAGAPDWLRDAARLPLPSYPEETRSVVLLSEQVTTVKDSGEITTLYRHAVKILRPEGRKEGVVTVYSDHETRISSLKGWAISAKGEEYEVKEKDAVETGLDPGILYGDTRKKVLAIPAAEVGSVVGYEWEHKRRPSILEDSWLFQEDTPVLRSRFTLRLPSNWEFKSYWSNHAALDPQPQGPGQWVWQLENLPGIESLRLMPPWQAIAGWLSVHYYPGQNAQGTAGSWQQIAAWYGQLTAGRRQSTTEIQQKVAQLTAGTTDPLDKIKALTTFVQHNVRYLAIKIGVGDFQPHSAQEIFSNRYGDCKDKVTLLSTMLHDIGIESYYVLINTTRDVIRPGVPSLSFDHAILALRLPQDVPDNALYSVMRHPTLGTILFFDPTDSITALGYVPSYLQASYGLLVTDSGGELVELPLLPPNLNRLLRSAKLNLSSDGTLSGSVTEVRGGQQATLRRAQLRDMQPADRKKFFENLLAGSLSGFSLLDYQIEGLEDYGANLVVRYRFIAENYAKPAGNLLLVRPRVLGQKSDDVMEGKERKYPVEFEGTSLQSDLYDITLPSGFRVDELPQAVSAKYAFGQYLSQIKVTGDILQYQRDYQISQIEVPTEHLADLKAFFRQITEDESNTAVLKRTQ
jgi:transglutaminase-like putative cysteine protease